jgi:hypothetical protein
LHLQQMKNNKEYIYTLANQAIKGTLNLFDILQLCDDIDLISSAVNNFVRYEASVFS